jgi:DNA (cytosine-5)-methyltransferase 1
VTFGSLFAGIGGMDLGLERAGMSCRWQVEIDPYARRVLAKHWPDVPRWDDVRTFPPVADANDQRKLQPGRAVSQEWGRPRDCCCQGRCWCVDLICGGFPCQDISFAGKGAGLAGERSGLWYEFARVVRDLRPRYVLVENVAALLVRGLDAVLGTLAADGYDAEWFCLPAAAVGAPHRRDRVFIVAHAAGVRRHAGAYESRNDGLITSARERRLLESGRAPGHPLPHPIGHGLQGLAFAGPEARAALQRHRARCEREQWGRDPADEPKSGVGRVVAGLPNRVDRLRGLGNAVVPQVAEFIGQQILAAEANP